MALFDFFNRVGSFAKKTVTPSLETVLDTKLKDDAEFRSTFESAIAIMGWFHDDGTAGLLEIAREECPETGSFNTISDVWDLAIIKAQSRVRDVYPELRKLEKLQTAAASPRLSEPALA